MSPGPRVCALGFAGPIAVHDYAERPWYHVIEEIARPIARRETLSVFLATDRKAAAALCERFILDPR